MNHLPIGVVLADNHTLYRQTLAGIITATAGLKLVGSAATGEEAIEIVRQHPTDVALIDVRMPGMDGMETGRRMLQIRPTIGIIAITMYADENYMEEMMKAGARGYLLKDAEQDRIIRTIKDVYEQGTGFDPQCTPVLTNFINGNCTRCKLNEAQKEVMKLVGEGYTSAEMTGMLNRGIDSVEGIRKSLYKACGVDTQVDLFKCGVRCRLIEVRK